MENLLNVLLPYIITAIGGILTAQITRIVPNVINLLISKVGLTNYEKMKNIALDIWKAIEEDGRLGQLTDSKINTFESMIRKQFPSITDDDIKLLNKSIAGEVNKGKEAVVSAVSTVTIPQDQLTVLQNKAQAYDQIQSTLSNTANVVQAQPIETTPQQ